MTDTRRVRASRQNLPRLQGARELMPAVCPACSRPHLRGTVVWLSSTLREGTQGPASRETVQRLSPMRRNACSRPRLRGNHSSKTVSRITARLKAPPVGEPWGKVPFRAGRGNLAFRPVSERAPSVRPSERSERVPSTRTPHQSERVASTRTPYNRNGLPPHSLPTS